MKHLFQGVTLTLLIAGLIFYSCKKEGSCESCQINNTNKPPIAVAGTDQTITLPINSILLNGSASHDPDGQITVWQWAKISGPSSFAIVNENSIETQVNNLAEGVYQFELKVADNGGLSARDTVKVIVNDPAHPNRPPVANAGPDQEIILPVNTALLDGSLSSDPDNNISSYSWTKISGPSSYAISNPALVQTPVTNLVEGVYQFEIKVTDSEGLLAKDTMIVTVKPPVVNHPPVANAGLDQTISLPTNMITLSGALSFDPDNNISGYQWRKIAGPSSFSITTPLSMQTQVTNLVQGIYLFELEVMDATALFSKDTVQITVNDTTPIHNHFIIFDSLQWNDPNVCAIRIENIYSYFPPGTNIRVYIRGYFPGFQPGGWILLNTSSLSPDFYYEIINSTLRIRTNSIDCNFDVNYYDIKITWP
jgi:hypothetical protein